MLSIETRADIHTGPLAFGSVDSPNPLLSSSPAAPSLIGGHLSNSVQSFGSLPADTSSAPAPSKRNNMTTTPAQPAAKKPLDPHMFFTKKSTPATQSQQSQSSQSSQQPQQPHPSQQAQQPQHPQSTQSHITSPPPSMNGHPMAPNHGQFRPSSSQSMMQQGQQMRQNGAPFVPRPMGMGQGMPQYAQQHHGMPYGYPQQQYQVSRNSLTSADKNSTLDSILNNSSIPSGNHNNNNNTINSNSSIPNISSNSVDLLLLSCLPVEAHPVYLKHNHLPLHLLLSCPTALFRQHLPQ